MNVTRYEISKDFNPLADDPLGAVIDALTNLHRTALEGRGAHIDWTTLRIEEADLHSMFLKGGVQTHAGPMTFTVDAVALSEREVAE